MDHLIPPTPSGVMHWQGIETTLERLLPGVKQEDLEQIQRLGFSTQLSFLCPRCREWSDTRVIDAHTQGLCEHARVDDDNERAGKRRRVDKGPIPRLLTAGRPSDAAIKLEDEMEMHVFPDGEHVFIPKDEE
jgi:hypothetical protein